ncbi:hypothetical protein [uncultured Rhodoblastus sp.]|uniref:hypothetical protein n=1 Tax=uncultured Rhodoblastus sp. TaxID=543037 RepID=UPI0025EE4AA7|nr:hypothetical protein [uncultured Rhodoblastus sp.]
MTSSPRLENFVAFSAQITAFNKVEIWGTGLADVYLDTIDGLVGAAVTDALLDAFAPIATLRSDAARTDRLRLEVFGSERLGPVARAIVKLWYIGVWYPLPSTWQEQFGPTARNDAFVPTPAAFVEGLLWPAIGSHPPGAKAPGYGSWRLPPNIPSF